MNPVTSRFRNLPPRSILPGICFVLIANLTFAGDVNAQQNSTIRRFSLVAGSNDGGPKRPMLRYAHNDAKSMARVLEQLGGVSRKDSVVLVEPDRFDFESGLARLRDRLKRSKSKGVRLEVLFYYSGHSDEQGLMLGDDIISYRELREALADLPADVRIAVLDSCSSGVLTRTKGGTRKAPFLMDTSVDVKGYAYLTSSSADESAQESDKVGGSFFTHYFVSGLRGAADTSKDNKVTLNEAYQYAFDETLARTESTQAGPQHPSYDFQLKGSGDLVLTDLRGTAAALAFPEELSGRIFVRNRKGQLVAEINKRPGIPIVLGLESGNYEVTLEDGQTLIRGTISLASGKRTPFNPNDLSPVNPEATVSRGGAIDDTKVEESDPDDLVVRPFSLGFAPRLSTDSGIPGKTLNRFSLNFIGWGDYLKGAEIGFIGNIRKETVNGLQWAGVFNYTRRDFRGFQWAGFFNMMGGSSGGFQAAGFVNYLNGPFMGFQTAGFANINGKGSAHGFQGAGLFNFNRTGSDGFQGAGFVNLNIGYANGFQGAGIFNFARSMKGAQLSAIANISTKNIHGIQMGLINYSGEVKGAQVGLINISKKNSGATVGLINVVGDGVLVPTIWSSYNSLVNVGVKAGSRKFFSILGYGTHPLGDPNEKRDSVIAGIGGHADADPLWLEVDLTSHFIRRNYDRDRVDYDYISKLRLSFGLRFADQFSFFAGPALSMHVTDGKRTNDLFNLWSATPAEGIHTHLGLGLLAGFQFEPKLGNLNDHSSSLDALVF